MAPDGHQSGLYPLGDCWTGICEATTGEPWHPGHAHLRLYCNLGYARGTCSRFPGGAGPDAVRFAVRRDDGATIELYYVHEHDHHPLSHGPLHYSRAASGLNETQVSPGLARQACAYAESYLRRIASL